MRFLIPTFGARSQWLSLIYSSVSNVDINILHMCSLFWELFCGLLNWERRSSLQFLTIGIAVQLAPLETFSLFHLTEFLAQKTAY